MSSESYPAYSRPERIADGTIHAVGVLLALTGAVTLPVIAQPGSPDPWLIVALTIYGAALVATFVASACYHMTPVEAVRPVLRRIDHAAIYFKIAGTYTPFVVLIGSGFAYAVLGLVWLLAIGGAVVKVFFWRAPGRLGPAVYLLIGWLSMALLWPLARTLPPSGTGLVVAGGALYSLGVIFFTRERLRYSNAIWHGFVLAASICFFAAIALGVRSAQAS